MSRKDLLVQAESQFFRQRATLADFMEAAWPMVVPGRPFVRGRHVEEIARHLEAVSYGEIKNLIVNIPPGMMKSLSVCVFWPVWEWLHHPSTRFFLASYTPSLTVGSNRLAMDLVQSEWHRKRWAGLVDVRDGAQVTHYKNSKGGERLATSVGGIATGFHPDIQIIDDPQKARDAESELARKSVTDWWGGTMASRGATNPNLRKVLIMQRVHEGDLVGHILETEGDSWEVLKLPMEYDARSPCRTSLGGDWRTEEGELLCPQLIDREKVDALKRSMGERTASAQLGQDPAPADGSIFKRSTFKFKPFGDYPARFDLLIVSFDCAFKATKDSDYVAGQVWGLSGVDFYLVDEFHDRVDVMGTCKAIQDLKSKHPGVHAILVEEAANGAAVLQILGQELSGLVPVRPEGGKVSRANAITPLFEAGNVVFPEDAPWVDSFTLELEKFPAGKHDDRVDAMSQALVYLRTKTSNLSAALEGFKALAAALMGR